MRLLPQKMLTGCDRLIVVHINPIFWVGLFDMLRTRTMITKQVKTNGWRKPKHGGLELEAQKPFFKTILLMKELRHHLGSTNPGHSGIFTTYTHL